MQPKTFVSMVLALGVAFVAACDRPSTATGPGDRGTVNAPAPPPPAANATPTTPANAGTPSTEEKKEGANPVQGQVDPKEKEQQRDFQKSDAKPSG